MKRIILLCILFTALTTAIGCMLEARNTTASAEPVCTPVVNEVSAKKTKIQVAILLDTSGSMQGLIEQAKSRLWNIVNTLTTLKYNGEAPDIEIALYEYGSYKRYDGDYIRRITPLTADLDLISKELFALTTNGSEEYCGTVIQRAVNELEWGNSKDDMKLIYIAGNEEFTQGNISYKTAIANALKKDIFVNTIHCGSEDVGIGDFWQDAALRGNGKFFNIDANATVRAIKTPFDPQIILCNEKLNDTYIGYGIVGKERKMNQTVQDRNAGSISSANYTERAVSKSKAVYKNTSWDLVDKVKEDKDALSRIKKEELPEELRNKSPEELKTFIKQKEEERTLIQKEINELAVKRQIYIDEQLKKEGENKGDDLGKAITESVLAVAKIKGYTAE
ncbi:VWA domain-containing protein [Parabacteroides sp. TM07-1AC]|uniref:vWA domain-containing protein n=1 Tax=Parabacteroides sp. TM07-1AC TaxID=2292363 RepID=UPI000F00D2F9|nr:VWA domain-containing protein [Parabacteroides sp. TM07-1AC]RHU30473.1 VWA domain-containing protein [Parabacteroides sp. TM07-1AC]